MRILSVILRVLTVLCIGGGFAMWHMGRANLKAKLGGKANEDPITTIYSIFDEQTDASYEVMQADAESEPKWTAINDGSTLYETTFSDAHPFSVLTDQDLRNTALKKLELSHPDPEKDQDENGVPDIKEDLPNKIRATQPQEIYDAKEQITLADAESQLDGAVKTLQDQNYRTGVLDPVRKEFLGSEAKPIISRKKPNFSSTETYENKLKTAFGKLYWERDRLYNEISKTRKLAVARDEHLQEVQQRYIARGIEKENLEAQSQHLELNLQDTKREFELAKTDWGEQKDALDQKIKTTEDNLRAAEIAKKELDDEWKTKMQDTRNDYENQLQEKERDAIAREQKGYERGREEVLQETGRKLAATEEAPTNYFEESAAPEQPAPVLPPVAPSPAVPGLEGAPTSTNIASGLQEQSIPSIVTNVTRISARDGIIILPVGSSNGLTSGSTFTLLKGGKQTAKIKVTRAEGSYCIANILPKFGDPRRLRAGDQIQVVR